MRPRTPASHRSSPRSGPAQRLQARLDRELARIARLGATAQSGDPDPEVLHALHRALRQLSIGLDLLADGAGRRGDRRASDRAAALAHEVGAVRDLQVARALLDQVESAGPTRLATELRAARAELRRREGSSRRALRPTLGRLEWADAPTTEDRHGGAGEADLRLTRRLHRLIERRCAELEVRWARAGRRPSVRRLHELRVALRNGRHSAALAAELLGRPPRTTPARLVRLQRTLGAVHDWAQLRRGLREAAVARAGGALDRELRRRVRRHRRRAIQELGKAGRDLERWLGTTRRTAPPPAAGRPGTQGRGRRGTPAVN